MNNNKTHETNFYTIKCKYVYKMKNGTWSTCKKMKTCKFAHNILELKSLQCNSDENCKMFKQGGMCIYKHSNETREEWLFRTQMYRPEMPYSTPLENIQNNTHTLSPKIKINNEIPTKLEFVKYLNQFVSAKIT